MFCKIFQTFSTRNMICQILVSQQLTDSVENFFLAFSTGETHCHPDHAKRAERSLGSARDDSGKCRRGSIIWTFNVKNSQKCCRGSSLRTLDSNYFRLRPGLRTSRRNPPDQASAPLQLYFSAAKAPPEPIIQKRNPAARPSNGVWLDFSRAGKQSEITNRLVRLLSGRRSPH